MICFSTVVWNSHVIIIVTFDVKWLHARFIRWSIFCDKYIL